MSIVVIVFCLVGRFFSITTTSRYFQLRLSQYFFHKAGDLLEDDEEDIHSLQLGGIKGLEAAVMLSPPVRKTRLSEKERLMEQSHQQLDVPRKCEH